MQKNCKNKKEVQSMSKVKLEDHFDMTRKGKIKATIGNVATAVSKPNLLGVTLPTVNRKPHGFSTTKKENER